MNSEIKETIEKIVSENIDNNLSGIDIKILGGGCINQAFQIINGSQKYFIKINRSFGKELFEAEAKGLKVLKQSGSVQIPSVINFGETSDCSFLLLEYIDSSRFNKNYWKDLGISLARLHKTTNNYFGLDHDNFIGSLPQINHPDTNWINFFIQQRIERQLKIGVSSGRLSSDIVKHFQLLYEKLPELLPVESPALLHGDLWSGNIMSDSQGRPVLIDPAVYFGNREAELAFTTLFGGFDDDFYKAYQEEFPLLAGFEDRFEIYNLYPLLVHVNLFGGGYINSVSSILRRYIR